MIAYLCTQNQTLAGGTPANTKETLRASDEEGQYHK